MEDTTKIDDEVTGVNIMNSISEATKKSKRWQEFSSSYDEEGDDNVILGHSDSQSSIRFSESHIISQVATPLFQTPSVGNKIPTKKNLLTYNNFKAIIC